jgi:chromosome partitioning protein
MSRATAAAIRYADLCLVPARPCIADIEATKPTLHEVRAWNKPFAFVLNQTPTRGQRLTTASSALSGEGPAGVADVLAQPFIVMRNDHQDALNAGLAVSEYAPLGKSTEEISDLWRWVEARLSRVTTTAAELGDGAHAARPAPVSAGGGAQTTAMLPGLSWGEAGAPWDACL